MGWSISEVARKASLSPKTVESWLYDKGRSPPLVVTLWLEAEARWHARSAGVRKIDVESIMKEYKKKSEPALDDIARAHGVARQTVARALRKAGVASRRKAQGVADDTRILELREAGKSLSEVASITGTSKGTVFRASVRAGWKPRPWQRKEEEI